MVLFYEDFTNYSSIKLNPNIWRNLTGGHGWGNNELQYYTTSSKNLYMDKDGLHIVVLKEDYEKNHYTSSRIVSIPTFQYGKISFSIKLPQKKGIWPAIWMLGEKIKTNHKWPDCGEIDLMEAIGRMPNKVHISLHSKNYNHLLGNHPTKVLDLNDNEFHDFVIFWTNKGFKCSIDGKDYDLFEKTSDNIDDWPFDAPFFFVMNVAIGGYFGGEVDPYFQKDEMIIKYLKVESVEEDEN